MGSLAGTIPSRCKGITVAWVVRSPHVGNDLCSLGDIVTQTRVMRFVEVKPLDTRG
jgi:hypothetical protein